MKHTKGPWKVADGYPRSIKTADEKTYIASAKGGRKRNPVTGYGYPSKEEAEANARLIATAPELLEALECVSIGIELHYETMEEDTSEVHYLVDLQREVDEAIKKAKQ